MDDEQEDQRQLSLHKGDNSISVQDMQKNWLNSEGQLKIDKNNNIGIFINIVLIIL